MAGPSIVVKIFGDLTGLQKSADDAASKVQSAAGKMSSAFKTALGGLSQTDALGPLEGALNNVVRALDAVAEHGKTAAAVIGALGAAGVGFGIALSAASSKQQQAAQQLEDAFAGIGANVDDYSDAIAAAQKQGEHFGYNISQTDDALRVLTQGLHDPNLALHALDAAFNLSIARHQDLSTSAQQLSRIFNGSGRILKEYGLTTVPTVAKATAELQTATQAAAGADQSLASARDTLNGAEQTAATSAKTLTDARKKLADQEEQVKEVLTDSGQYARDLVNAQTALKQSSLSLLDAQSNLLDVQQKLYDIQHGTGEYARDQAHAQLQLQHAQLTTAESTNNLVKAQNDLVAAQKSGDTQKINDAQLALANAHLSAADATQGVADAQANLKKINDQAVPGTKAYNDLQRELATAQNGITSAANAQVDAQAKVNSLVDEATPGTKAYADMMDKLHGAQQDVADATQKNADAQQKMADAADRYKDAVTKAANAHKDLAKAQSDMDAATKGNMAVIDQLNKLLGPQAEAAANTFMGQLRRIRAEITDHIAAWGKWGGVITAVSSLLTTVAALFILIDIVGAPVLLLFAAVVIGIAEWVAIGYILYHNWDTIWRDIKQWVGDVWHIIMDVYHWIRDNWPLLLAILTGPFGTAIYFIVDHWSGIVNFFKTLLSDTVNVFKDVGRAIATPFIWAWNEIAKAWNNTVGKLHVHIPKIGPFGGADFGMPHLPTVALQQGGIVTGPTMALLGEAGPEAVIPLGQGLGPAVNIEQALFTGGADLDLLMSKVAFATTAGRL